MTTVSAKLQGIDAKGLANLAETNKTDPSKGRKVLHAVTRCEAGFRNVTSVRDTADVVVSEPCGLLGDNVAANPSEVVLAALGSCISVGLQANATQRGIALDKIELVLDGDIDISAVWGVGDTDPEKVLGFTDIRIDITLAAEGADEETLKAIADTAIRWSPVVATMTNPVRVHHSTTVEK
ncbi:OsmC family protein [Corynebacterium hansenii]|uniref:OsmC family protein n=1 Tax=Corynebacterium hansenii TaxID=394964 RepID=A0ABV7ZL18_9CORY|nr:OsmC family protein [Corynebacterium hansenii]WJY98966.1 OsmC-like protein [Corynebacterium hansenii]